MLKNAIYGFAIGDALGVPFEFKKRGTFQCTDMVGFGTWNQKPGTWSDDTSLTLATCKSIKDKGYIDIEDIKTNFKLWLFHNEFTVDGIVFDVGNTTREALMMNKGLDDFHSNGNGSLMRILPLAFANATDEEIIKVSSITHAHDISIEACKIYVHVAKELSHGRALKDILNHLMVTRNFARLKILDELIVNNIKSTGFVVSTLEASLWCLLTSNSYEEAVLKAVNLGDDTDTIAAITGGLAGMIYDIPKKWIDNLRNKEIIDQCLF